MKAICEYIVNSFPSRASGAGRLCVLVPRLAPHPAQSVVRLVGADLYAGAFGGADRLLDALHQVLRVADQHLGRLAVLLRACGEDTAAISFCRAGECGLGLPWAPSMVAFTVERIFSCVPMVGMRSHTCSKF